MADDPAVQLGSTIKPEPDPNPLIDDSEHDPLAEGGGDDVADPDTLRKEMNESNDDDGPGEVTSDGESPDEE